MANKVIAYLALGSNIDDRLAFLAQAEDMLKKNPKIEIIRSSKIYETEPWPRKELPNDHPHMEEGQKWFLNQVISIKTTFSPAGLLKAVKAIEQKIGRTKTEHWGPREIDIDILLYGDQLVDTPDLHIPHRHIEDRQFVLVPLVEIAPDLTDPMTGRKFNEILKDAKTKDAHQVTPFL
ncbi:MAG: 2-amino-4-hydroxy-6-hydroxymethyldihydropteridine diphosphokinase [Patescibacteria group bacterium]